MDGRFSSRNVRFDQTDFQSRRETRLEAVSEPLGGRLETGHHFTRQSQLQFCLRAGEPNFGRLARQRMPRRSKVRRVHGGESAGQNLAAADSSPEVRLPVDVQRGAQVGKRGPGDPALKPGYGKTDEILPLSAPVQAESDRGHPAGAGDLGLDECRLQPCGDGPELETVAEGLFDQCIQLRILELFPPVDIDRSLRRRCRIPCFRNREARLPFGRRRGSDACGSRQEHGQQEKVCESHPQYACDGIGVRNPAARNDTSRSTTSST